MRAIRILLIDHHPTFLRLATDYLREHYPDEMTVVGTARTGEEGLTLALSLRPYVVLLDTPTPPVQRRRQPCPACERRCPQSASSC
jgi:DNA-binding NarL/FixJ family response regulator